MKKLEESYYRDIRNISLLTIEEERALAKKIQEGDQDAREKLVQGNVRLVIKIARQYYSSKVQFSDLLQEGNMGLLYAVDRYNPRYTTRFANYAGWWIRHFISQALDRDTRPIRIPYRVLRSLRRQEVDGEKSHTQHLPSTEDVTVESTIVELQGDSTYDPEKCYALKEKRDLQTRLVNMLEEKEKKIIAARFPMDGGKPKTLATIGSEMNVTAEAVRTATLRVIKKLHSMVENGRETMS